MTENTPSQKPLMRVLIILSGLAFAGTTIVGMADLFSKAFQEPKNITKTATDAKTVQLQAEERGYEQVLQREPDNQFVLQKLVEIRLQKNDLKGAIAPMEKLVKLNPDKPEYKALLEGIKQRTGGVTGTTENKSNNPETNKK